MGLGKAELSFTVLRADEVPEADCPRWAVLGRSNVGKSTLLNALIHPKTLFKTGRTPGVTRGLVGVRVMLGKSEESALELVDLPGYGYAEKSSISRVNWDALAETLRERSHDRGLLWIWLVDPYRVPEELEHNLLEWLGTEPFILIFTKADGVKEKQRQVAEKAWARMVKLSTEGPFWVSGLKGDGIQELHKSARQFVRFQVEERK